MHQLFENVNTVYGKTLGGILHALRLLIHAAFFVYNHAILW